MSLDFQITIQTHTEQQKLYSYSITIYEHRKNYVTNLFMFDIFYDDFNVNRKTNPMVRVLLCVPSKLFYFRYISNRCGVLSTPTLDKFTIIFTRKEFTEPIEFVLREFSGKRSEMKQSTCLFGAGTVTELRIRRYCRL